MQGVVVYWECRQEWKNPYDVETDNSLGMDIKMILNEYEDKDTSIRVQGEFSKIYRKRLQKPLLFTGIAFMVLGIAGSLWESRLEKGTVAEAQVTSVSLDEYTKNYVLFDTEAGRRKEKIYNLPFGVGDGDFIEIYYISDARYFYSVASKERVDAHDGMKKFLLGVIAVVIAILVCQSKE